MRARPIRRYTFIESVLRLCGCRASLTRWRVKRYDPTDSWSCFWSTVVECDACHATWHAVEVRYQGGTDERA